MASRILLIVVALVTSLTVQVASAQSLGEVAKKERERRSKIARDGPVRSVGNRELSDASGDVSVMGRAASEPSTKEVTADGRDAERTELTEKEVRELREKWARVWAEQVRLAEEELELAKDAVYQCESASHYVWVPLGIDCNGVYERRALAQYRLDELRDNRYNWELLLPQDNPPTIP